MEVFMQEWALFPLLSLCQDTTPTPLYPTIGCHLGAQQKALTRQQRSVPASWAS